MKISLFLIISVIEAIVIGERKAVEPSEFYTDNSYDVNILENYGNEVISIFSHNWES